jgi:hypothetical protein
MPIQEKLPQPPEIHKTEPFGRIAYFFPADRQSREASAECLF